MWAQKGNRGAEGRKQEEGSTGRKERLESTWLQVTSRQAWLRCVEGCVLRGVSPGSSAVCPHMGSKGSSGSASPIWRGWTMDGFGAGSCITTMTQPGVATIATLRFCTMGKSRRNMRQGSMIDYTPLFPRGLEGGVTESILSGLVGCREKTHLR